MDYKKDIIVYDLETPEQCFLASFYIRETGEWRDFLINAYQNDLYPLLKFLDENKNKWFCGYNVLKFDGQVIEFILKNYSSWIDKSNLQISYMISQFASEEIDKGNYGIHSTYKEYEFTYNQLDLPSIWHFFNENRRVSLKQLEFEMRAENIENLEFELDQTFSEQQVQDMIVYCHNDVTCTDQFLEYTIGNTDNELYKGKDKIKDREIIMKEVGLPCMNYDDVKIGAEWNKKDYMMLTGKRDFELKPQKVNYFYGKKYRDFFPKTVTFQTENVKSFIKKLGQTTILNAKQEFIVDLDKNLQGCIAKGGIHSREKERFIKPLEDSVYIQNDIGSQYPNFIRKGEVYPKHLGKEWYEMIVVKIARRLHFKNLFKETKDPTYGSMQEMGKLSLNGGAYGKLGSPGDWQEDPCAMLTVTLGCQLEILMIVEALILKGFEIVSLNTDGWDSIVPKSRLEEYFKIVSHYEKIIGNEELGNVEYTRFEWIAQTSVNHYVAKKIGEYSNGKYYKKTPELKSKGMFAYWVELWKNSSFAIFALAWQKYFDEGIDPEELIMNHDDIFDFCARSNSGKSFYHESYDEKGKATKESKLIRYYVGKKGKHIKKVVREGNLTGAKDTNLRPADNLKVICNRLPKSSYKEHLDNIDRQWYITEVKNVIYAIENGKKPKKNNISKDQLSMF